MEIACDAVILFAERHAALAERAGRAASRTPPAAPSCARSPEVCRRVPAHAPRDFHEALQTYWFCHLAVITELNGWDSFNPGHLDQHLGPSTRGASPTGTLTPRVGARAARVLLRQVQQPPRAAQGRRDRGGERHLHRLRQHQPRRPARRRRATARTRSPTCCSRSSTRCTCSSPARTCSCRAATPDDVLAPRPARGPQGLRLPVALQRRRGRRRSCCGRARALEDARAGGCSGCVETGAFGKEAYILTGYFNLPKMLELALHDGVDPRTGRRLGPRDRRRRGASTELRRRLRRLRAPSCGTSLDVKIARQPVIERMYAAPMPAPVPLGADRRLHREGPRLQRRRARATTPATSRASASAPSPTASRRIRDARLRASKRSRSASCSRPLGRRLRRPRAAAPAARQPHAQVRQRRRPGRRPHAPRLRGVLRRGGRPARTRGAAPTASRCCPRPATSTSAR